MNRLVSCPHCLDATEVAVNGYDQTMQRCGKCGQWLGVRVVDMKIEVCKAVLEKV